MPNRQAGIRSNHSRRNTSVDRGQLIILAGLVLAISFVALALLLNTAIFTENLASRGQDPSPREAIEFRQVTMNGISGMIQEENEIRQNVTTIQAGYDPSRDELFNDTTNGISQLSELLITSSAERGQLASVEDVTLHNGTGIHQPDNQSMTSNSDGLNWTLASDVEGTRNFSMIPKGNLTQTGDPANESFRITVSDGSNDWALYVYENASTGDPDLSVMNGSESSPTRIACSMPASLPMEVDLTGGAINGTDCSAIQFGKGVSEPYSISYTWGNRSNGTYELTVNSTNIGGVNSIGSADSPFQTPVIYSAEFNVSYTTDSLSYRDRVNVTPD